MHVPNLYLGRYQVLHRCCNGLEGQKPKYYAKLDMTWGYWQTPISEASKGFTAFTTFMGTFERNRAPNSP